jgi:hypothetical protein
MDADLDTLATALYVRVDDALKDDPALAPWRPAVGIAPKLSDAELVTVAVMQALPVEVGVSRTPTARAGSSGSVFGLVSVDVSGLQRSEAERR